MTTISYLVVVLVTMIVTMAASLGTLFVWLLITFDKDRKQQTVRYQQTPAEMWTNYRKPPVDVQINNLHEMYKELKSDIYEMKTDYEKRFQALSELSKEYSEGFQKIDDTLDRIELDRMNDDEKAKWLEEREGVDAS